MANTKLVLKDSANNFTKDLGSNAKVKDVIKASKDHEGGEIVIEEEKPKEDPLKPVNIKVVQLTGTDKKKAPSNATSLSGVVISFDKPSDWAATLNYSVRLYDKNSKGYEKEAKLENIVITDAANTDYGLTGCSKDLAYYYYENAMAISEKKYKDSKLVQVKRKKGDDTWSDWGTELHTDITMGGKMTIFKTEVEISYKTGDENVGLKPGQDITIKYKNILEESFAENFPRQIFEGKPETSLMGMSVKLAKLNYNTRTKTFQVAVQINTNDIDVDVNDAKSILKYYKESVDENATEVPADVAEGIKKLKTNGIELVPGFAIKEIYFELNKNDESPKK